jgi:hypothetical protein
MYTATTFSIILPIILVISLIYIPHFITTHSKNLVKGTSYITNFLTPGWIITSFWAGVLVFVLIMDGEFLDSGLAQHIVWATIALSVVQSVFSKVEMFQKFSVRKGDIELEAETK